MIPPKVHLLDITGPAHIFYEASCYGAPVNLTFSTIDPQQTETESAERQAALKDEIEKTRRGAWVNALLKNLADPTAPFDPTAFEKAIPATGWPAGVSQSDFHFAGERVLGHEADDVGSTLLGKMLKGLERK